MGDEEDQRPQSQRSCGKLILRLLFSHVGLFLLVCLYAGFGAWLFSTLEFEYENYLRKERYIRSVDVNDSIAYLSALFYYLKDKVSQEEWDARVYQELRDLDRFIVGAVKNFSYDSTMDMDKWDREWSFGNGLLYSVTILTTIGYGHVTPKTQIGKVVTILYSLIGIPLTLIFLANIGDLMASFFRYAYSRLCCRWCRGTRRRCEYPPEAVAQMGGRLPPLSSDVVGEEAYMPTSQIQIPILLNLMFISLFILLGSVMFAFLEEWDMLSSGYFTFITLTTIGFGDYFPGKAFHGYKGSITKTLTLMGTCFYMMLGMALVSMCINLMQEQLTAKVKWVANEIGLIKQPDIPDTDEAKPLTTISATDATSRSNLLE
ncbi:TWiK family of potassium channels protein 7-like [Argiope bruennichi]|uniref:TWiK family of potassium channels protein 7-like n=1 Tax=Argiope bruennichi TaxID=94029 RepID=UPI002493F952|nr:TWiK family of potassium channels protein 7-like [Argiope bruennichi]